MDLQAHLKILVIAYECESLYFIHTFQQEDKMNSFKSRPAMRDMRKLCEPFHSFQPFHSCGGPGVSLTLCCLWFILRGDLLYVFPCVILFLCFSVLLVLRLPRLGEERANLSVFRTFVRFVLI